MPTARQIMDYAAELQLHNNISSQEAYQQAKEKLTPLIVQAFLAQLPSEIEHRPGDQFFPDLYYTANRLFARGRLDEYLIYHLYLYDRPTQRYDLYIEKDLARLFDIIIEESRTRLNKKEPS